MNTKLLMTPMAVGALAVALASCGGSSAKPGSAATKVLVDANKMALYTPDGETAANVRCTGACTSIWKPLRPGDATLTGAGTVAVITRPDGTKQLAAAGKPLYTFAQDSPGAVTGNGVSDAFAGKQFTWHAVTAGGTVAAAPATNQGGSGSSSGY